MRGHSGDQPQPDVPCLLVTCKQQVTGLSLPAGIWMPLRWAALAAVMAGTPPPLDPLRWRRANGNITQNRMQLMPTCLPACASV